MKAINNFENVQATTGDYNRIGAGGYCIEIIGVKDVPLNAETGKGDYLKIEYDICDGEFAGYYTRKHERFGGDWLASFIRSYKEKAYGMFKHFINCVEESNAGYKWAWDEKTLVHKEVGVVLGEEEYRKNDGSIGVKLVVKSIKTTAQIEMGDFKVPALKKLADGATAPSLPSVPNFEDLGENDDLPF